MMLLVIDQTYYMCVYLIVIMQCNFYACLGAMCDIEVVQRYITDELWYLLLSTHVPVWFL